MFTYASTTDLTSIAATLRDDRRIIVTTHAKPDGDAIGSALALRRAFPDQVEILLLGPVTSAMRSVAGDTPWQDAAQQMPAEGEDRVVVVDTGAFSQLEAIAPWLGERPERIIVIDHHASGDDLGPTRYVDSTAASCTMIVFELLELMSADITGGPEGVAEALFCGLATDTGWFRHSNADARAFAVASRLLEIGLDRDGLFRRIEETSKPTRLALQARALASIDYVFDGRGAIMALGPEAFRDTGGVQSELAGVVNSPLEVASVEFAVLICCEDGLESKISFRSKPPRTPDAPWVNVSDVAAVLGGGGHVHASGARIHGSVEDARQGVLAALRDVLA